MLFYDDAFALFKVYQTILILHEINTKDIRVKHSQINRSFKGQAEAFKASPFDSSLQTTGRETVDSRLQARSSFGRATFHLQEEKTSLTRTVSSSMLLRQRILESAREYMQAKRKASYVCNGPFRTFKTPRFKARNVAMRKYSWYEKSWLRDFCITFNIV